MSAKRKLLEEWQCPACLDTIEDGCIPAVMNGCAPFACVACMTCLNEMLEKKMANCPLCRAPFINVRPLASFVDNGDPVIADALAKKARVVTLADKIAALNIEEPRMRQRVAHMAKKIERYLAGDAFDPSRSYFLFSTRVPEFDRGNCSLTIAGSKKILLPRCHTKNKETVRAYLELITARVTPFMEQLFPAYKVVAQHRRSKPNQYLSIRIYKK